MPIKKYRVARDSRGKVMWVRGRTDISPLTFREFNEGRDMKTGRITKDYITYYPPFTVRDEEEI